LLLIRGILAALRQKIHLTTCPNSPGHLSPGGPFRIPSTTTTLSRGLGLLVQVLILTGTC